MLPSYRRSLALVAFASLITAPALHAQPPASAGGEAEVSTAPVVIDGDTLFRVRGVSSVPAAERATQIQQRVVAIAADPTIAVDSIQAIESNGATRIVAGERPLMMVFDADASVDEVPRTDLAYAHVLVFRKTISEYREARSESARRRYVINALIATVALIIAVALLLWLWRSFERFANRRLQARIHSVEIQSFEVMRAERIWSTLRGGFLAVRTIALAAVTLIYVGYVLGQFPLTRGFSRNMFSLALAPLQVIGQGILDHIPSLVFLIVLYLVIRVLLRMTRLFFEAVERGTITLENFDREWALPTYKILRLAIVAFGLIVAYPYIPGSDSAAFKGVSVFIGILFSLGSSNAIANVIAGYMMTYRRAFKVGDRVRIGDAVGDVVETRLLVTHLRSLKNEELVIPNSQILSDLVLNYSSLARTRGLILHTEVGIGYETPWRQVEALLLMAAERTPGLVRDPQPFVLEKRLGDFAVTYELNVFCQNVPAMTQLYAALHRNILDVFNEFGVQIMTPAYEGDPETPKVVAIKDWHLAPAPLPNERDHTGERAMVAAQPTP
jgi:small-conductance mechanosensitive channel